MLSFSPLPQWTPTQMESQIFSIRVAQDNSYVAAALSNGEIALLSATTGRLSYTIPPIGEIFPTTSIRFHPKNPKSILSVSASGIIRSFSTQGKSPKEEWHINENNQIFALDVNKLGTRFATAGLDKKVRVYDYEKQELISSFYRSEFDEESNGHTNRIFSVLFHPTNANLLISAGWDDTIQFWDLRTKSSIRSTFGPHVVGDSMDAYNELLAVGSWRTRDQLQLFDLRTFTEMKTFKWSNKSDEKQGLVYTAKFHPNGDYIIAGGSGDNKLRSFSTKTYQAAGKAAQFDSAVYTVCLNSTADSAIVGTQNGGIYNHKIQFTRH